MALVGAIKVEGLAEVRAAIKRISPEVDKQLGQEFRSIGKDIADEAKRRIPVRTGRAKRSVRAVQLHKGVAIYAYRNVLYGKWLDFGGTTGRGHEFGRGRGSIKRLYITGGRYVWRAFGKLRGRALARIEDAIWRATRRAGLEAERRAAFEQRRGL